VQDHELARLAMVEWREALAGITSRQVACGLSADVMRGAEWPPSSAQFRALCLGIPEFAAVLRELRSRTASRTPFTRLVWQFVDTWRLGQAGAADADRMVRDAYGLAREHVMQGGDLPPALVEIAQHAPPPNKPASPETVAQVKAEMARLFGEFDEADDEQDGDVGVVAGVGTELPADEEAVSGAGCGVDDGPELCTATGDV
jgi:hypothetical protein